MKKLLLVAAVLSLGPIDQAFSAESCTTVLRRQNGREIERFLEYGYSKREACRESVRECQRELNRRHRNNRNPKAYCDVERFSQGDNPRPSYGNTVTCEYKVISRINGGVVDVYVGSADRRTTRNAQERACEIAEQRCEEHDDGPLLTCRRGNVYYN